MNWSPMSMKAIRAPARPRNSNSKNAAVPSQRVVDVADLERDVVDPDQACHAPLTVHPQPAAPAFIFVHSALWTRLAAW